jgi:endo-1,4-beta-xylanase
MPRSPIRTRMACGTPAEQLARRYADVFRVLVKHRDGVTRVTFWGLSDADSWLNSGRMNYSLLWDRQRQPKPAFTAVVDALRSTK